MVCYLCRRSLEQERFEGQSSLVVRPIHYDLHTSAAEDVIKALSVSRVGTRQLSQPGIHPQDVPKSIDTMRGVFQKLIRQKLLKAAGQYTCRISGLPLISAMTTLLLDPSYLPQSLIAFATVQFTVRFRFRTVTPPEIKSGQ
jgi:hypothetical protein